MYSNNILNFQESTILNACTKKSGKLLTAPRMYTQGSALNNLQGLICHKTQPTLFYKDDVPTLPKNLVAYWFTDQCETDDLGELIQKLEVVIYEALCFDVAQGRMNETLNEKKIRNKNDPTCSLLYT